MADAAEKKQKALAMYQKRVREHKALEAKVKACTQRNKVVKFFHCPVSRLSLSFLEQDIDDYCSIEYCACFNQPGITDGQCEWTSKR